MERPIPPAAIPNSARPGRVLVAALVAAAAATALAGPARADKIVHPTAVFSGLDKITGRIISFDVAIDETVQFGALQITPRVCYTRPPTENPLTDSFVEVDDIGEAKQTRRIFSGWMFADSPGLHGVEHPVYDVWLTDCKGGTKIIHEAPPVAEAAPPDESAPVDAGATDPKTGLPVAPKPKPKPKPRPPAPPPVVITPAPPGENAPLDLGAGSARNPVTRRYYPTDAPPVPPADIPN